MLRNWKKFTSPKIPKKNASTDLVINPFQTVLYRSRGSRNERKNFLTKWKIAENATSPKSLEKCSTPKIPRKIALQTSLFIISRPLWIDLDGWEMNKGDSLIKVKNCQKLYKSEDNQKFRSATPGTVHYGTPFLLGLDHFESMYSYQEVISMTVIPRHLFILNEDT